MAYLSLTSIMTDLTYGLSSDTSTHEAFIVATIAAEQRSARDFEVDELIIKQAISILPEDEVNVQGHYIGNRHRKGRNRRRRRLNIYKHNMDIKEIHLDYEDLCGRVASL